MGYLFRLLAALLAIGIAYVLIAPRVPALRGWYASNACPYLDRVSQGLCERTLRAGEATRAPSAGQAQGTTERPQGGTERVQGGTERLDRIPAEIEQLRRVQQEQGSVLATLTQAQQRRPDEAQIQQSVAAVRQELEELRQTVAALRQEVEQLRASPPAPARPAPARSVPARPARPAGQP